MEPTGVEPVSALGISTLFIHRFSLSNPRGRNRHLSLTVGFSGKGLSRLANQRQRIGASVGVKSTVLNGVKP